MGTTAATFKELKNLTTDREEYSFDEEINKLDAKINPLTVLTNQIGKRGSVDAVQKVWYQEELDSRQDVLSVAKAAGTVGSADTVLCTTYTRFHKWDTIKIPETGYVGIITATVDSTTLTTMCINKGSGEATNGENIIIMGPAIQEGSAGVDAYQGTLTKRYNLTTTLQRSFKVSREVMVNAIHGGEELPRLQNKKGREAAKDLEFYLWHGIRKELVQTALAETTAGYQRWNGGIFYYLTTVGDTGQTGDGNATYTDIGGALTESAFQSWLFDAFTYTDTLYLFCGKYGLQAMDNWARGKLNMVPKDKSYGLNITEYPLAGRMAYIVDATRVLTALSGTTDYEGHIVALDLADITFYWYKGEEMKLHTAVQPAKEGLNRREDVYQGQFTLKVGNAKNHAIAYNISGVG